MYKKFNSKTFLPKYFRVAIVVFVILAIFRIFYSVNLFVDTFEHIHASFLVGQGLIPYKDFFEHHHPLLWYLFAPVTWVFYRNSDIIYIARFIAVFGYFMMLWFVYKISKKYSNSSCGGYLSILLVLCFPLIWNDVQNLRPDIFMYIAILVATDYFLTFLDTKKVKHLCISYFLWLVAFLFLQKAVIYGLGFALANIYLLKTKNIRLNEVFKASILPFILLIIAVFILLFTHTFGDYYNCNVTFNRIVMKHYGIYTAGLFYLPFLALVFAFIIIRYCTFNKKQLVCFLMWLTSGISILCFAPYVQYYFFFFILSAILLSSCLVFLYNKNSFLYLILCTVFLFISFFRLAQFSGNVKREVELVDYVLEHSEPSDKLLNGDYSYNLFNFDTDYHWFGFFTAVILADLHTNKTIDYNEQIQKYKPKFLFLSDGNYDRILMKNMSWVSDRNFALIQKAAKGDKFALSKLTKINIDYWQIDMDFVKKNYYKVDTFGATDLWQRIDIE